MKALFVVMGIWNLIWRRLGFVVVDNGEGRMRGLNSGSVCVR